MIILWDNPFSPFARKVRMVLDWKGLVWESIDALALEHHAALLAANPRGEVPVLVDGPIVVVDSADIVDYLDHRYPTPPIFPADPARRAAARAWQRVSDTAVDAVVHDVSIWTWPTHHRCDSPPAGLIEAAHRDLRRVLERMEAVLAPDARGFLCGEASIADLALFPHVSSFRLLGLPPTPEVYPAVCAWLRRVRELPAVQRDLEHVKQQARAKFATPQSSPYESEKIVWRGDRLEWMLANGFHGWWLEELAAGRAVVPSAL